MSLQISNRINRVNSHHIADMINITYYCSHLYQEYSHKDRVSQQVVSLSSVFEDDDDSSDCDELVIGDHEDYC